ncbi:MAG: Gldg family protein [Deltaproteobacteria bacterium]|nr:Gldg family protein [Deltaproteobacteria bacterium]
MTRPNEQKRQHGADGLILSGAYLLAMVLLFIGERLVLDSTAVRMGFASIAGLLVGFSLFGRVKRLRSVHEMARPVERRLLILYLMGLLALVLYGLQADFVMESLRSNFSTPLSADRYQGALSVAWVVLWLVSILPLIFTEISYAPMDTTRTVDHARVSRSMQSGAVLAMSLALVFLLNYIVSENDKKVDLSYFKTTRPSESSAKMVKNLSEPLKLTLFFSGESDVFERVEPYFKELAGNSKHFKIQRLDHVLEPKKAKEMGVHENGSVVVSRGKRHRVIILGKKLRRAKSKLKKLDSEFQGAFIKLMQPEKVAYFTVGHEERTRDKRDGVEGSSTRDLRKVLRQLNYRIKNLGLAQGLGNEVPKDASVVIIAGPRKAFLPAEAAAIEAYLRGGGRALLLLDPEPGDPMQGLLSPFGLKFTPELLANERLNARLTFTKADGYAVVSNRYGAHGSVKTLARHSKELALVSWKAGYLEEVPPSGQGHPAVSFTVHSMPFTYNDANQDLAFDKTSEKQKLYELASAVSMSTSGRRPSKKRKKIAGQDDMRMIVVADSDAFSDKLLMRSKGNVVFVMDALKWLVGEEAFLGAPTSEEDVRIMHTRKEDQIYFYLTIFALPLLVLVGGLLYTRQRRRK